jgi:hypothetical protein
MAATQMLKTMVILVGITQLCMHFRLRPAAWRALSSRFGQVANVVHDAGVRIEIDEMAVARRIQRGPIVVRAFKPGKTCASTRTCRNSAPRAGTQSTNASARAFIALSQ